MSASRRQAWGVGLPRAGAHAEAEMTKRRVEHLNNAVYCNDDCPNDYVINGVHFRVRWKWWTLDNLQAWLEYGVQRIFKHELATVHQLPMLAQFPCGIGSLSRLQAVLKSAPAIWGFGYI